MIQVSWEETCAIDLLGLATHYVGKIFAINKKQAIYCVSKLVWKLLYIQKP